MLLAPTLSAQQPVLEANTELSTDGYFVLSWEDTNAAGELLPTFRLEESTDGNFDDARLLYSGVDKSRVISGKPDGLYQYRVALSGPVNPIYSELVTVEVAHHSMRRALAFFLLGLIVFGAILVTVILGTRSQRNLQQ